MSKKKLDSIIKLMRKLDTCMMTTQNGRGNFSSRPMSNNGDVAYDGNSYFFSYEGSKKIKEIEKNPQVSLEFSGPKGLYISLCGKAKLIRTPSKMRPHWQRGLNQWFKKGLETPGIVMIHVKGNRIAFWQKNEQGETKL